MPVTRQIMNFSSRQQPSQPKVTDVRMRAEFPGSGSGMRRRSKRAGFRHASLGHQVSGRNFPQFTAEYYSLTLNLFLTSIFTFLYIPSPHMTGLRPGMLFYSG